ncbi:hypothetical protein CFIMG_002007RAa [Ceratocystis fimbriata CBS 114723]|uniref:Uncharacterized protein n=1 Tax=Ceratocystis fimbriata CBS 114723 TaxID=1035309 RepID=A0A2C5XA63_9PEZI|nr:hypothetical protein CFIMG_002007RAa [Ceratocystis fimbriata CBS 114723]
MGTSLSPHIEAACRQLASLPQQARWLHDLLGSQGPCAPMDTHGPFATRILEYLYRIERIRMHR